MHFIYTCSKFSSVQSQEHANEEKYLIHRASKNLIKGKIHTPDYTALSLCR